MVLARPSLEAQFIMAAAAAVPALRPPTALVASAVEETAASIQVRTEVPARRIPAAAAVVVLAVVAPAVRAALES